ncbi:MAG: site-specific integrase [Nitrososphaerales archaeon]
MGEAKEMQEVRHSSSSSEQKVLDMRGASLATDRDPRVNPGWFKGHKRNWEWLLASPKTGQWLRQFPSDDTRNHYGAMLNILLKHHGIEDPDSLFDLGESNVRQLVRSVAPAYRERGKMSIPKSIAKVVKSLFGYYDLEVKFRWGEFSYPPKKAVYQHVPKNHEVYKLASATKACVKHQLLGCRNYALVISLWQSGVRNNCISRWTFGMLKEYIYPEIKAPAILKITSDIDTKLRRFGIGYYYTFLSTEALLAVRDYTHRRTQARGSALSDDELLFVPMNGLRKRLDRRRIDDLIRTASPYAGFDRLTVWPHTLRKSFNKVLLRGGVDTDLREAMMGHRVPDVRGNYWDYHDFDEALQVYQMCDWSELGSTKMDVVQQKLADMERILAEKVREIAELRVREPAEDEADKLLRLIKNSPEVRKLLRELHRGTG